MKISRLKSVESCSGVQSAVTAFECWSDLFLYGGERDVDICLIIRVMSVALPVIPSLKKSSYIYKQVVWLLWDQMLNISIIWNESVDLCCNAGQLGGLHTQVYGLYSFYLLCLLWNVATIMCLIMINGHSCWASLSTKMARSKVTPLRWPL